MNAQEELTKLLMESYDRGVEDTKQAAIEGIQEAILLEREACAEILDANAMACTSPIYRSLLQSNADAIRARGQG